ncbi:bifunctional DNA-formamidopyrimidine glycosylase/DNA-(apurinic or apyrimidinic site) lyase [Gayadomonas joobiniege]|uniref:bifunctional DNA-formamidopyrimidine glycosylase/DNA-(apurinic or apyrimidinic site) lyase n=1 Tax=Gayadomonas joobiniege TaxID=1234606 RepID=UPI0003644B3D|nr:bifunctional DNA-formamidopyrimidine glycosylase/DNA-(apurinic or apyrimidinic site) lyase [Gayadomonas joobiniege]
MPELPEVEVTRMGVEPWLLNQQIELVNLFHKTLRWPLSTELYQLKGQTVSSVERRAKYLLIRTQSYIVLIHLGMSGKLCVVDKDQPRIKHDHFTIELASGKSLRLNDPRRFGAVLLFHSQAELNQHMQNLGPEPFDASFNADYLYQVSRSRKTPVKAFIMDNSVVVGVGNIYATEALFLTGIHPARAAGKVSLQRYQLLVDNIRKILTHAIEQGGTTLKDFTKADGKPGYFALQLKVYGKAGQPCPSCETLLKVKSIGQRASVYCSHCQK